MLHFLATSKILSLSLSGSAKLVSWKMRKNKILGVGSLDPLEVKGRIKIEYAYYYLVNDVMSFSRVWRKGRWLWDVGDEQIILV